MFSTLFFKQLLKNATRDNKQELYECQIYSAFGFNNFYFIVAVKTHTGTVLAYKNRKQIYIYWLIFKNYYDFLIVFFKENSQTVFFIQLLLKSIVSRAFS